MLHPSVVGYFNCSKLNTFLTSSSDYKKRSQTPRPRKGNKNWLHKNNKREMRKNAIKCRSNWNNWNHWTRVEGRCGIMFDTLATCGVAAALLRTPILAWHRWFCFATVHYRRLFVFLKPFLQPFHLCNFQIIKIRGNCLFFRNNRSDFPNHRCR